MMVSSALPLCFLQHAGHSNGLHSLFKKGKTLFVPSFVGSVLRACSHPPTDECSTACCADTPSFIGQEAPPHLI
jgi:hypothetical protein